jgi:hypothetical protein
MTELKAVAHLDDTNLAQAINYLEAYNLPVGLYNIVRTICGAKRANIET